MQRQVVELVPGYGVQLSQRQLDEALDGSNQSPTRLIRNLLSVFFSKDILASSSAYGGRKNAALDRDILGACLSKYICVHARIYKRKDIVLRIAVYNTLPPSSYMLLVHVIDITLI